MSHDRKSKLALERQTDGADRDRSEGETKEGRGGSGLLATLTQIHDLYESLCQDGPASSDKLQLGRWLQSLGVEADADTIYEEVGRGVGSLQDFDAFYDW
jgi:hypothetical protein